MPEWTLLPGQRIRRRELHESFGGSRQSGISPSRETPNILIFSEPESGEQHGYIDGWKDDECFHYTGEGKSGDQELVRGNRAIIEAEKVGRALRVFNVSRGEAEYQGRFALDAERPWYRTDAEKGPQRTVIVFRLRPIDTQPKLPRGVPAIEPRTRVQTVPVEGRFTERAVVNPPRESYMAERRESELVHALKAWLERQGHTVNRRGITPADEAAQIWTDMFIDTMTMLVEAKGTTDRWSIRMAIGQLLDYRRLLETQERQPIACAVLVPTLPRPDLLRFLAYAGVVIWYPRGEGFVLQNGDGIHLRVPRLNALDGHHHPDSI